MAKFIGGTICTGTRGSMESGGDGVTVRIWGDRWLFSNFKGKVLLLRLLLNLNLKVGCFFNRELQEWRTDIIAELFPWDVANIRDKFISRRGGADRRFWGISKDGVFRVNDVCKIV